MENDLISELRRSAERIGGCDPLWLRKGVPPVIDVQEGGSSGPVVLLLHGLFGAMSNWDVVFPKLALFCRPIAITFPLLNAHTSEVKVKALSILVEYFIKSRSLKKVLLCGNSLGGHVALRLALSSPNLVSGLILSGASGLYERTADTLPVRPGEKFVREHMSRVFFDQSFVTESAIKEIADLLKSKLHVLNRIYAARSAKRDNLFDLLPLIDVPSLLLWGQEDFITTVEVGRTFNKQMKDSELHIVEKCGHAPMMEHPDWFAQKIQDFIKKHAF
jgi:2-hydroxy-6-oxonona-2,4-dienedioate hydrolase